jgi:O-antigen ligase
MTRSASATALLVGLLCAVGVVCLAVITLASPSTTRMFAWPWTLVQAAALIAPPLALTLRSLMPARPLVLPSPRWATAAGVGALVVLASAWASPYRTPSLWWSAPLLSSLTLFLLAVDWLNGDPHPARRQERLHQALLIGALVVGTVSVGLWCEKMIRLGVDRAIAGRNAFPLGHANYVAGFALLFLPVAVSQAWRGRGGWRLGGIIALLLMTTMLLGSGSRGGMVGFAALLGVGVLAGPLRGRSKGMALAAVLVAGLILVAANPRTRTLLATSPAPSALTGSDVQRTAMIRAGWLMGLERPWLGWGPGTTPLAYPRFRARLDGGAEDVLQLHSLPLNLWAELGAPAIVGLLAFGLLVVRDWSRSPAAAWALAGYAVFSLTDWQLDIPVFAAAVALLAASIARPAPTPSALASRTVGSMTLGAVAVVALMGGRDPAPELNVRALVLAQNPANAPQAIRLLRESLALNPHQEIAHFNLGWLLVVDDPGAAERHFLAAAHLVPDKGGVYFGLGLARLNQGHASHAASAFALECLNDPAFLHSPWWSVSAIAATRMAAAGALAQYLARPELAPYRANLDPALLGQVPPGPETHYRRTRTGYPVLMRNLDLPAPVDLFDVREVGLPDRRSGGSLPPKGWLPSPRLLALLDEPLPATP